MYDEISRSPLNAPVTILNFVPFEHFSSLDYKLVANAPVTLQCPYSNNVLLIYPNERSRFSPEKVADGLYKLISEGLVQ